MSANHLHLGGSNGFGCQPDLSMKQNEAESAVALYNMLVQRALEILEYAPFRKHVWNPEYARLSIEGTVAALTWPVVESGYEGDYYIERGCCSFPAALLFISDDELAAWKIDQRAIYDQQQREREADEARGREAAERAAYERLKQKFV